MGSDAREWDQGWGAPPTSGHPPESAVGSGHGSMTAPTVAVEGPALARWRRAITTGFGVGGVTVAAWGPRLPAIKTALGINTAAIGLILASVTVGPWPASSCRRRSCIGSGAGEV